MPIVTACSQDCPDTCSLVVETSPSGKVSINGNPDHPFTAGFCCAKLKSWNRRMSSPHRITAPLLRDGTGWREIGWEEALDLCAARIQALRAEPLSILHLDSSGNMGLMVQVPQQFFNLLVASRAVGSLCAGAGMAACRMLIDSRRTIEGLEAVAANWPAFRKVVMTRPAGELAEACGVELSAVERLAAVYGSGEPAATLIGWGLQRRIYGAENVRFINALALLSGQIGRSGGGSYYISPSTRHLDLSWMAKPSPDQVKRFFKPTIGRDILAAEPAVKMIWANGTNPVNQSPDSHRVAHAFHSVPFKVVVDAFMTDTAALADLILPFTLNWGSSRFN